MVLRAIKTKKTASVGVARNAEYSVGLSTLSPAYVSHTYPSLLSTKASYYLVKSRNQEKLVSLSSKYLFNKIQGKYY